MAAPSLWVKAQSFRVVNFMRTEKGFLDHFLEDDTKAPNLEQLGDSFESMIINLIETIQGIAPGVAILGMFIAIFVFFTGCIIGNKQIRGAGIAGLIGSIALYSIAMNAPIIVAYLQSLIGG